jgi:hypothetical protein
MRAAALHEAWLDECAAYFTRLPEAGLGRLKAMSRQDTDHVGGDVGALVMVTYPTSVLKFTGSALVSPIAPANAPPRPLSMMQRK